MTVDRLLVRGPFHGPTGYDHHVREFVRALAQQGVSIQLVDLPYWGAARLAPEHQDPWFDTLDRPVGAEVALHFTLPHQVVPYDGLANVNYTMFEATNVHPSWIGHNSKHALVVVPTESSRRAWLNSGFDPRRIRVSPLGVDAALFGQPATPSPIAGPDRRPVSGFAVRFLNVSELSPRKNQYGLLRAWLRATRPSDDAVLILKLGLYSPDWQEVWDRTIVQIQHDVGKRFEDAAPIHTLHAILSDSEMPRLYATATHYISMSFGEGWDQPMVEAAASGLRLIAPDHSAYQAYLDRSCATLIPSREVPAHFPGGGITGHLFRHTRWWEPDEEEAEAAIRSAIEGRDTLTTPPRERILTDLTWTNAARRLLAVLDTISSRRWWRA